MCSVICFDYVVLSSFSRKKYFMRGTNQVSRTTTMRSHASSIRRVGEEEYYLGGDHILTKHSSTFVFAHPYSCKCFQEENPDMGVTVADARFMKPLDVDLIRRLAGEHDAMLTVEENAIGGFGAHVLHFMVLDGLMDDVSYNSVGVIGMCF